MWALWKPWKICNYDLWKPKNEKNPSWKIRSVKKHRRKFPQTRERDVHADEWRTRTPKRKGQKSHFPTSPFTGQSPESQGCPYPNPRKGPLSPAPVFQVKHVKKNIQNSEPHMKQNNLYSVFLNIILAYNIFQFDPLISKLLDFFFTAK